MKTLKILLVVMCVFCFVNNAQGQSDKFAEFVNITQRKDISKFTKSDWEALFAMWKDAIKINGIKWYSIPKDEAKLKKLFGHEAEYGMDDAYEIFYENKKKGLYFRFASSNDYPDFYITNRHSNITIMGVTLTIGDFISKLKNVKINYEYNLISFLNGDAGALHIYFDPKTKKITKIEYTTWT